MRRAAQKPSCRLQETDQLLGRNWRSRLSFDCEMVRVFPDHGALSQAVARRVATVGTTCAIGRGGFQLVLSGGRTPLLTYEILAATTREEQELWRSTHVFWGDERCVPREHAESNYRTARLSLLDIVPIPSEQVHPIAADVPDPEVAARLYESDYPAQADLLLLGVGEDGHTASLYPGSSALREAQRRFVAVEGPVEPRGRITMTPPAIASAREVLVIVSGSNKAAAVGRVFCEEGSIEETPARLLRGALWYADKAAAVAIPESGVASAEVEIERAE